MNRYIRIMAGLGIIALVMLGFNMGVRAGNGKIKLLESSIPDIRSIEHEFIEKGFEEYENEFDKDVLAGEAPMVEKKDTSILPPPNEAADRAVDSMQKVREKMDGNVHLIVNLSNTASELDRKSLLDDMIFGYDRNIKFGFQDKELLEKLTIATDASDPLVEPEPLGVEPDVKPPLDIIHEYEDIAFDEAVKAALENATKKEFEVEKEFGLEISGMAEVRLLAEIGVGAFEKDNKLLIIDHRQHFIQEAEETSEFNADPQDPGQAAQGAGADPEQAVVIEDPPPSTGVTP